MRRRCLAILMPLLSACFGPSLGDAPFVCGANDECPSGYHCEQQLCIRDGLHLSDAGPGKCIPNTVACSGDSLVTCDGAGDIASSVTCAAGCNSSGRPATCYTLTPSNIASDTCDHQASASLVLGSDMVLDTRTCGSGQGVIIGQSGGGPDVCVYKFQTISIGSGVTLRIIGPYIAVLVATQSINVQGTIDAGGHYKLGDLNPISPGPGATSQNNTGRGGDGNSSGNGGGGGGFVTKGYTGGAGSGNPTPPGNGGGIHGNGALVPMVPGSFGGVGAYPCPPVGPCPLRTDGGAAGGGLQLVSCGDLTIAASAIINAGGGGGGGGAGGTLDTAPSGGSGGGSGGAILIEAPRVNIPTGARIVANGGAGGGGGLSSPTGTAGARGQPGNDASLGILSRAAGGASGGAGAGNGGDGSNSDGMTGLPGTAGATAVDTGGGGGGAGGRIRLNARPDKPVTLGAGAILSPFTGMSAQQIGSISRH